MQLFEQAAEYLSGSCHTAQEALVTICNFSDPKLPYPTQELLDGFDVYLDTVDMWNCDHCGWWGYPGGGYCCDCNDECYDCGYSVYECECES